MKPPYWSDVYPHGTPEGDEEFAFFTALSRDKQVWLRTYIIAKLSGLSERRVEEIIQKYLPMGVVFQHEKKDDEWAYWERVPDRLPKKLKSVSAKDHEERISRYAGRFESD